MRIRMTREDARRKLEEKFEQANWGSIDITMKCNGDVLRITPCGYGKVNKDNVEYFLVEGGLPWMGANTIAELLDQLTNYNQMVHEHEKEKKEIRDYFEEHIKGGNYEPEEWGWYSDWHKDVFGYRPHAVVCGEYVSPY